MVSTPCQKRTESSQTHAHTHRANRPPHKMIGNTIEFYLFTGTNYFHTIQIETPSNYAKFVFGMLDTIW